MTDCHDGEPYLENKLFPSILVVQMLISLGAIFSNIVFVSKARKDSYYHINIRIIIGAVIVLNIVHSLVIGALMAIHAYLIFFANSACDVLLPAFFCIFMRIPTNISMIAQTALNTALAAERIFATVKPGKYERVGSSVGVSMVAGSISVGVFATWFMMHRTPWEGQYAYCTTPNHQTSLDVNIVLATMGIWEFVVILIIIGLYYYNKHLQERKSYQLGKSFQVFENIYVTRLLFPWMLTQFVLHAFFYLSSCLIPLMVQTTESFVARSLYLLFYVIPLQCMVSPLILWFIRKKQKHGRTKSLRNVTSEPPGKKHNYIDLWE